MHCKSPSSSSNKVTGRLFAFFIKYLLCITVLRQRLIQRGGSTLELALSDDEPLSRAVAQASLSDQSCTLPCNKQLRTTYSKP